MKSNKQPLYIGLAFVLFVFIPAFGYFFLLDEENVFEVKEYFLYEDESFSQIKDQYQIENELLNLGFVKEAFLGFDVSEGFSENDKLILEIENPTFKEVLLYQKNKNNKIENIGKSGTYHTRDNLISNPFPTFQLQNGLHESTLFLHIRSEEPINLRIKLIPEADFYSGYSQRTLIINVYMGIMFALFLYNFILFFLIRDSTYFFYSVYILFISLTQLSLLGNSFFYILDENPYLYGLSIIGFSSISGMAGLLFMRKFLKTKEFTPVLDKFILATIFIYLLAFVVRISGLIQISYSLTDFSGLLVIILFLLTSFKIARLGYRPAIYFIFGWVFFISGLLLFILMTNGLVKLNIIANFPMLVGTAMEAILLSLALADKINILKKEKEDEQAEKLRILKENESLILEQNEILESKVKVRTEELEETLRNLQNTQTQLVNQEKMASLGQLTAGIAHEINNPINFVSSNISPLKRDIKDLMEIVDVYREKGEEQFNEDTKKELKELEEDLELEYILTEIDQLLRGMDDGAKRTVEIVKGLRLFSRVDEQDVKKVDIHDGINSTLVLLNSSMSGRIKIEKDFAEIPMIECLAGKINQVFMNIITNAIHALTDHLADNPNPLIKIKTSQVGEFIKIEIGDNGPGMPDSVKERIFEPFFTTKAVGKGTGLGLSIVYTIIENHKGTLEVDTSLGKGTNFIITLPIYQNTPQND
ncbi:sensor histidine kinase [Belliella baltica]|nr:7TM diverse intracellular signaling domain-containing protein [Belliella baltica]